MREKATITENMVYSHGALPSNEERQAALAISPLFRRIDDSILWVVTKIFAAARDKRVKRGGCLFLAHLLRFSVLVQLSLFSGTEVGDAARIAIPNILKFCRDKANGWPWCYDTTLKYLNLLVAAGVLATRPDEPGIYYLPLSAYALLPEYAAKKVEKLARKRAKVSHSTAFKRTAVHCTLLGDGTSPDDAWIVDSPKDAFVIDEEGVQRMVQALSATLQSCQGVALLPTTMVEVARVVAKQIPRVLKKGDSRFIARSRGKAMQLLQAARNVGGESTIAGLSVERSRAGTRENLLPGNGCEREATTESTRSASNLLVAGKIVDSRAAAFSDISSNKDSSSDITLSENARAHESTKLAEHPRIVDSAGAGETTTTGVVPAHPLVDAFSLSTLLFWRFPQEVQELELGRTVQSHLAALLSRRFNGDDEKVGHYMKLLVQDCRVLDIAIIDGLVRSAFPDPRCKRDELKGAWVTKMYKAYRDGDQVPDEILAWADTTYTYDAIKAVLAEAARRQEVHGQPRRRPRPEDVIVDSAQLGDFWAKGAAQGLKREGYCGVTDGDLLLCDEYEQRRLQLLACVFDADFIALSPEVEGELASYRNWIMPWVCGAEEEARLLADLPKALQRNLKKLERILTPEESYVMNIQVAPLSRHHVVEVKLSRYPGRVWFLHDGGDFANFDRWYKRSHQLLKEDGGTFQEESTNCIGESYRKEAEDTCMGSGVDLKIGPYTVNFDAVGAVIKREETRAVYRLNAVSATNATDFVRFHRSVVVAMANDDLRSLEAYRVEQQTKDEQQNDKTTEE